MKAIVGLLVIVFGTLFSLYLGLWVLFIGGILDIIGAFTAVGALDLLTVGFGILKIMVASIVGWVSFLFFTLIGSYLLSGS